MNARRALAVLSLVLVPLPVLAQEKVDWAVVGKIRDEGFRRSQVMETAAQLTDVHGPRMSATPQYKKAAEWARQQLEAWGLQNARLEGFPFGRGWSFERASAHVVSPVAFPLVAIPKAWTAGTTGAVRGKVLRVKVDSEADVEALKGKIAGMVLWVGQPRDLKAPEDGGVFKRYTDAQLADIERFPVPGARGGRGPMGPVDREAFLKRRRLQRALEKLYEAERPLAVVEPSERDGARRERAPPRGRRLAQEGRPAGGDAAGRLGGAVGPGRPAPRPQGRRGGRDRRPGHVPRGRHERLQRAGRAARHGPQGRAGDARRPPRLLAPRRPPRLLAPRHRRHRQRRGLRGDDGGHPDPEGGGSRPPPHRSRRAVGRRGARAARLAGPCRAALRLAPRSAGERPRRAARLHAERAAGADHAQARPREAVRLLQPRQRHREGPRDLPPGERRRRSRSSRRGWRR